MRGLYYVQLILLSAPCALFVLCAAACVCHMRSDLCCNFRDVMADDWLHTRFVVPRLFHVSLLTRCIVVGEYDKRTYLFPTCVRFHMCRDPVVLCMVSINYPT